ncbi:O-antigen ligase family protein [candidate division WOR-3 bacterium]|nr:O-antigen ligase family protein [candidate division WOR-3 bacterium]
MVFSFSEKPKIKRKDWIKIIVCSIPIFCIGLYKGGAAHLAVYLMGLYAIILLSVFLFINQESRIKKNRFLLPLAIFTGASLTVTLLSPALLSSMEGFLEYFAYLIFFTALLLIKPDKKVLLLSVFIFCLSELVVCFFQLGSGRVSGTYEYANFFVFPLIFGFLYSFKLGNKTIRYSLMILFFVFSVLTGSRIVLVLILVLPFFLFERKIFALIAPILIGLVLLVPNPIKKRVIGKVEVYSLQRPNLWKQAIRTGLDRPLSGWGLRSYKKASLRYNFPVEGKYLRKARIAHNEFLQFFAEGGIILSLAYLYLFFVFFMNFKKIGKFERILITVIFIHSLFDNVLYLPANFLIFIVILFSADDSTGEYKVNFSLPFKVIFILISFIYLIPLSAYVLEKKGEIEFNSQKYGKAIYYLSLAESLWPLPSYSTSLATVNEQLFHETGLLGYLSFAFYLHSRAMESNPIDWELPFKKYEFFKRYKQNIYNKDAAETAESFLLEAIELNPKNRILYETLMRDYKERGMEEKAKEVEHKTDSIFPLQLTN